MESVSCLNSSSSAAVFSSSEKIAPLLRAYNSGSTEVEFSELLETATLLLGEPPLHAADGLGYSDLNSNGSPLQWLLSIKKNTIANRLIADPAFYLKDVETRSAKSLEALRHFVQVCDAPTLLEPCLRAVESIIPKQRDELRKYETGIIRLAVPADLQGLAMYVGAQPGLVNSWEPVKLWVNDQLNNSSAAVELIESLEDISRFFGIGIQGVSQKLGRVKIYWRITESVALSRFQCPLFVDENLNLFLDKIMQGREFPLHALTFSAGFKLSTGDLNDIKVDVCNTSIGFSRQEAVDFIQDQIHHCELHKDYMHETICALKHHNIQFGAIGYGVNVKDESRINSYLYANY